MFLNIYIKNKIILLRLLWLKIKENKLLSLHNQQKKLIEKQL